MIAISSHRLHGKSEEFRQNQMLAKRTWEGVFSKIIYAGQREPELQSQKTFFYSAEDWPSIQTLAKIAAAQPGFTAVLNADIVVTKKINQLEAQMWARGGVGWCGSSRRYHFDRKNPKFDSAQLKFEDRGRDIFIAHQSIWKRIANMIPGYLRIGHQQWDAWMTDFFNDHYKSKFIDFTYMRCVFHPNHEDRQMPFANDIVEKKVAA